MRIYNDYLFLLSINLTLKSRLNISIDPVSKLELNATVDIKVPVLRILLDKNC